MAFGQAQKYQAQLAFPSLIFSQPVGIYYADNSTGRLYVVEQVGLIKSFDPQNASSTQLFLDLTDKVLFGGEQGLLGLAFHPHFSRNGYLYIDYTAPNPTRTVIARYSVEADNFDRVDINSGLTILEIDQPFPNHNGGQIMFGPDGNLYIGIGDGGNEGDPLGNGQSGSTLLGKILRIDVDNSSPERNYSIPQDNPFFGSLSFKEEIYAYGFRNPWRFSFDPSTGNLWVGDVGQSRIEEIDIVKSGKNYGWKIMEGSLCNDPPSGCNQTGLELPLYEYSHNLGNAIIGGYVYHGSEIPELNGSYIYGDYGSGKIWSLMPNGSNVFLAATDLNISSFGVDEKQNIFICAFDGKIYKISSMVIPEFPSSQILSPITASLIIGGAVWMILKKRVNYKKFS
jgi:glucose/arabinose dehydrogenase